MRWVGYIGKKTTWAWFTERADFDYNPVWMPGLPPNQETLAQSLLVVGKNWWLERGRDSSGYECWKFKAVPVQPDRTLDLEKAYFIFERENWDNQDE